MDGYRLDLPDRDHNLDLGFLHMYRRSCFQIALAD